MNYRHAFHAGNFADVFKHVLLVRMLVYLTRKAAPLRYIDTHAGRGLYDLAGDAAGRTGEWRGGIGRLAAAAAPGPVAELLAPYLAILGPRDDAGRPSLYPGSPVIAQALLRPVDRLIFCELHPEEAEALGRATAGDRRAKVIAIDGQVALRAYVPPVERRGLVLIDPPYEAPDEFDALAEGLVAAHGKWPTGTYAVWYPLKHPKMAEAFALRLAASGVRRLMQIELTIDRAVEGTLSGCGFILVNPPFALAAEADLLLPFLAARLARSSAGGWRRRRLVGE